MNADQIKFHASAFDDIYTGVEKGWDVEHSQTCKMKLVSIMDELRYGRRKETDNKFCEKGTLQEMYGIRLASKAKLIQFKKNEERFSDEWLTAIPDDVRPDKTIDFKCSWDLQTFRNAMYSKLERRYNLQGHIQMALTGKKTHWLIYCLVNTPAHLIQQEISYLRFKYEVGSKKWYEKAKQIEANCIFNYAEFQSECANSGAEYEHLIPSDEFIDIPISDRVFIHKIERDEELIQKIYARAKEAKEWMQTNLNK